LVNFMKPLYFIFALHNHQPVGNFDHVFEEAYQKAYLPFLNQFEKTSKIKICLHTSGPLWDWLQDNHPDYGKRLERLVKKGRIEVLSGGYYEPLLSLIRDEDSIGQLKLMNAALEKQFRVKPKGFWLTERVWEPSFPTISAASGLTYTVLDDTHFQMAGLKKEEIFDYFVTENKGDLLTVFPINKQLRYFIPFHPIEEIRNLFKEFHDQGMNCVVLADDGEKFGMWPGTQRSVYEEKWLEHFFSFLEESSDWLKTATFSEALETLPSRGRVYLPTASYEEMMEWALPSEQQLSYRKFQKELEEKKVNDGKAFVKGGFFRNFFAKYSESNQMQNKQLFVSKKVSGLQNAKLKSQASKELYQGECNCPYWHGVFGGLYLHHLRNSTYQHLITAEALADQRTTGKFKEKLFATDFNCDGKDEWIVETKNLSLVLAPHGGGSLLEWDDLKSKRNVLDTMTRRFEPYHDEIKREGVSGGSGSDLSNIHERKREVTQEVLDNLVFDKHIRTSWLDRFFRSGTLDNFKKEDLSELKREEESDYSIKRNRNQLIFSKKIKIEGATLAIQKKIEAKGRRLDLEMNLELLQGQLPDFTLGSEWNVNLKSNDQAKSELKSWDLKDEWSDLSLRLESERQFSIWQFTIQT